MNENFALSLAFIMSFIATRKWPIPIVTFRAHFTRNMKYKIFSLKSEHFFILYSKIALRRNQLSSGSLCNVNIKESEYDVTWRAQEYEYSVCDLETFALCRQLCTFFLMIQF